MDQFLVVFSIILVYIILLFIFRYFNIGKKKRCGTCNNCCPDCNSALSRVKRISKDDIINNLTFRIFHSKRYTCTECAWKGLRWEHSYSVKEIKNKIHAKKLK